MAVFSELRRRIDVLWRRYLALKELGALGPEGRNAVARDIGVTPGALWRMAGSGRHDLTTLSRLLGALGLDQERVTRERPSVAHDLEVVCADCGSVKRCTREFDRGTAAREFQKYCPNVETIATLLADPARRKASSMVDQSPSS